MKVSIACIAFSGKKVLIAHRNPVGQMGDRWEFPGGKVEEGEDEKESVVREMQEEFGMTVECGEMFAKSSFEHNGDTVELHVYRINVPHKGIFKKYILTEHQSYKWVPIEKIPFDNFVDSDLKIYPIVKDYILKGGKF